MVNEVNARRSLREHVNASGYFLWREGHAEKLLNSVRRALSNKIEFLHPGWGSLPREKLYQRLAESSGLSTESVSAAMEETHLDKESSFTQCVRTLENIRKNL